MGGQGVGPGGVPGGGSGGGRGGGPGGGQDEEGAWSRRRRTTSSASWAGRRCWARTISSTTRPGRCWTGKQEFLGIHGLTLHSSRVGGATEASEEGVSMARIKEAGGVEEFGSGHLHPVEDQGQGGQQGSADLVKALRF